MNLRSAGVKIMKELDAVSTDTKKLQSAKKTKKVGGGEAEVQLNYYHTEWFLKDYRTRFLCVSSCTFLLPLLLQTCWSLKSWKATFMSFWCALTFAVSVLFWYNAKPGWRHELDAVFAKISFWVISFFAYFYGTDIVSGRVGWCSAYCVVLLYLYSCRIFSQRNSNWVFVHATMHLFVGTSMLLCTWTMERKGLTLDQLHPLQENGISLCFPITVMDSFLAKIQNIFA